jgi:hypothetical protein
MVECSDIQRGQIVGVPVAGASVTKTPTILGYPEQQFPGYEDIHQSWEDIKT